MQSVGYAPSAPPLPTQSQQVHSDPSEIPFYHMHVKRVYVDNEGVLLYQNKGGVVYKTLNVQGYDYPPENVCMCMKERTQMY